MNHPNHNITLKWKKKKNNVWLKSYIDRSHIQRGTYNFDISGSVLQNNLEKMGSTGSSKCLPRGKRTHWFLKLNEWMEQITI